MAREEVKGAVGGLKTSPASQNDVDIGSRKVGDLNGFHRESAVRLQAVSLLSCSQPACLDISVPGKSIKLRPYEVLRRMATPAT